MITRAYTVAFQGIEARQVEVQCAVTAGLPAFSIVGCNCKPIFENYVLIVQLLPTQMSSQPKAVVPFKEARQPSGGTPFYLSSSVVKNTMD